MASDLALPTGQQVYFLEVLADGPAQLLYFRSAANQDKFYVRSGQLPLTELVYRTRDVERDGRTFRVEETPYRQTLALALAACAEAVDALPRLPFNASGLRRVVQRYNACQSPTAPAPAALPTRVHVRVGLIGGWHRNKLDLAASYRVPPVLLPYKGYTGGVALAVTLPRLNRKVSAQLGALFEQQHYDAEYVEPYRGGVQFEQRSHLRIDLWYLRLPLLLRYTYPRGLVRPLAELGLVSTVALRTTNEYQTTTPTGTTTPVASLVAESTINRVVFGLGAGAGLATEALAGRSVALLLRLASGSGYAPRQNSFTSTLSVMALLSIDLNR